MYSVINEERFWDEVKLLATNNYGPWNGKDEAAAFVIQAISQIATQIQEGAVVSKKVAEIVEDMIEE